MSNSPSGLLWPWCSCSLTDTGHSANCLLPGTLTVTKFTQIPYETEYRQFPSKWETEVTWRHLKETFLHSHKADIVIVGFWERSLSPEIFYLCIKAHLKPLSQPPISLRGQITLYQHLSCVQPGDVSHEPPTELLFTDMKWIDMLV